MVNTRSQKRRGMPKRATRKNLKNRNAQTKRRGQQKGGEEPTVNINFDNPTHESLSTMQSQMSLSGPKNPDLKLTDKIIVFDFDATLTTSAGHSKGIEKNLLNGEDKFGGNLNLLVSKLKLSKEYGYTLYINSRSSRCALLKFFGKDTSYKQNNKKIIELGNLFTDIYGSSESSDYIVCNEMNMTNVPPTGTRKEEWVQQKMMVIEDIITKHGGKENITELYFFDDEGENIDNFNKKYINNLDFNGKLVKKGGNTLFLIGNEYLARMTANDYKVVFSKNFVEKKNEDVIIHLLKQLKEFFKKEFTILIIDGLAYYNTDGFKTYYLKGDELKECKEDECKDFTPLNNKDLVQYFVSKGISGDNIITEVNIERQHYYYYTTYNLINKGSSLVGRFMLDRVKELTGYTKKTDEESLELILKKTNHKSIISNPTVERIFELDGNTLKYYIPDNKKKGKLKGTILLDNSVKIIKELYNNQFKFSFGSSTPKTFTLKNEKEEQNQDFKKLFDKLKYIESSSLAGGRKSKSKSKTRTQKRRSTKPKNKRTRKSKK